MIRTKSQISYNMSRIKAKGSAIEKLFASELRKNKLKYRGHLKNIIGKPDYVIKDRKVAIFCDSSFWHGYKFLRTSRHKFKSNKEFWVEKIEANIKRDKYVNRTLRKDGWKVFRFWDFQINKDAKKCVLKIKKWLQKE
ncbi:MAG: very short patch repair endonuclease [Parcubacteria group bacterium]|jgi:DNA mismatch endonuclease (patch repair protein)|nr:very short patch repair endonuclease [Parcubacteria group bacterium]